MKRIIYKVTYAHSAGQSTEFIAVFARNIDSGFPKVYRRAKQHLADETIHAIEFSEVTS